MRSDIDPDVFLSEVFQLRGELNELGKTIIADERLTTIFLDALLEEMYSTVEMQCKGPRLGLEEIIGMMKTIFINRSERSSVSKRSKESYRKVQSSRREPRTDNVRESAMTLHVTVVAKSRGIKKRLLGVRGKVG